VLKRILERKREEDEGGWRRLHNEELHKFYASLNIIRSLNEGGRGGRECSTQGGGEKCKQDFGRKN
jgi:hypothetical protein